jgi:hypothetical protein
MTDINTAVLTGLMALEPGQAPANYGPLCADWYSPGPGPEGCEHATCYAIAYRDAPPHECAVEADHADPISIEYGMYLATCRVCDLWDHLSEQAHAVSALGLAKTPYATEADRAAAEAAWEAATERGNR